MNRLKRWARKIKKRIDRVKLPLMYWAVLYAAICLFCIFLYILMTIIDWWVTGKGNEPELRAFVTMLLSGAAIGGIVGIGRMFVDKDNNNIPDIFEKDDGIKPPPFFVKGEPNDERRTGKRDGERDY
nr:MAG TPA: hypothetical protein [Caudoviricetes sp.]